MRTRLHLALLTLTLATTATAQTTPRMVLVELFTSEGCSSCPPADAMLARLNGMKTSTGDQVVVLSEHVTYWNQGAWQDPFSSDEVTARQRAYGEALHVDEVYTPQMVINGEAQVNGSDTHAIVHTFDTLHHSNATLHIASATPDGHTLNVTFNLSGTLPAKAVDIYAAISEDTASTDVKEGENKGRTISHVAVASSLVKVAKTGITPAQIVHIRIPAIPRGATTGKRHLTLFAQMPDLGPIVATDSVPL
jgi:hypothetical protein